MPQDLVEHLHAVFLSLPCTPGFVSIKYPRQNSACAELRFLREEGDVGRASKSRWARFSTSTSSRSWSRERHSSTIFLVFSTSCQNGNEGKSRVMPSQCRPPASLRHVAAASGLPTPPRLGVPPTSSPSSAISFFGGIHNSYRRKLGGIRTSSALMLEFEIAHALDKLLDADEDWRRSGLLAGIPPKEGHS